MQKIEYNGNRVETGAVQFGKDWPGLFIRGDDSFNLAMQIKVAEKALDKVAGAEAMIAKSVLSGLRKQIIEEVICK